MDHTADQEARTQAARRLEESRSPECVEQHIGCGNRSWMCVCVCAHQCMYVSVCVVGAGGLT